MTESRFDFEVLSPQEYVDKLAELIPRAKRRVILMAMTVHETQKTKRILELIHEAAARGVKVTILADVYSLSLPSRQLHQSRHSFRLQSAQLKTFVNKFTGTGGEFHWLGRIGLNPYSGRHHAKVTIIDDIVMTFGGMNFADDMFENLDYMLYAEDPYLAQELVKLTTRVMQGGPTSDLQLHLGSHNTLLFDAGKSGQSIIYKKACELARQATKIIYVSQMCPSGELAKILKQKRATCYFNRPNQSGVRPDSLAQLWDNWRSGISNHYQGRQPVHSKCMLFEIPDGTKAVLSGSHNFSWRGVSFGTQEIALYSTDPMLWRRLQNIVYQVANR